MSTASDFERRLIHAALESLPIEEVLADYCRRLNANDLPLWRGSIGTRILHPNLTSFTVRWHRGGGIETEDHGVGADAERRWLQSPLFKLIQSGETEFRRRLERGEGTSEFPMLAELRGEGATDYLAAVTRFDTYHRKGVESGMVSSWATDRPGGFTEDEVGFLKTMLPALAVAVKTAVGRKVAENLAATYLGEDAGRRILRGEIERGAAETLNAAILFCDLRGFTALSDRLPPDQILTLLDGYFDDTVGPIAAEGGQVLKFMGDGLLATFAIDGERPGAACRSALDAAVRILDRVRATNARRLAADRPVMAMDIALHLGAVMYGNVGARDRLDFTVIGPAVNEASRIEALCAELDCHLLISRAFADAAGARDRLVSVGRHALRGIRRPQELFTTAGA